MTHGMALLAVTPGHPSVRQVTNITDYGAFVEIEPGIEGLVHVSEMDWTNKNVNPAKVVQSVTRPKSWFSRSMATVVVSPWA